MGVSLIWRHIKCFSLLTTTNPHPPPPPPPPRGPEEPNPTPRNLPCFSLFSKPIILQASLSPPSKSYKFIPIISNPQKPTLHRPIRLSNPKPNTTGTTKTFVSRYARASALPGVCIATNLVNVAITGQVPRRMIGTDAFQETPIFEVTRSITKHNYLVLDVDDIPRIVREAFLIDIPKKDIQQQLVVPNP
ncbi:hypothetical protein LOK49_LG04G02288 [Camellia lanceoleosa]|uniref:Uncharacterized protein n=1 Tax=Camellia lanceoleosa TaxID=1840588 RepID=A0ACC0I2Y6_9ERIC|nr:hypothetical protein LOK49_LG04G02288 [Camellia lanceoleosa]